MAISREFVALDSPSGRRNGAGFHPCQGVYWRPEGARPKTAFIATHYNVDFSEHYLAPLMAERGYGFLGWNTRFRGQEQNFLLDHALIDIGVGMRWLREQAGVTQVVIVGNSGGGSLMAAYQSQAVKADLVATPGTSIHPAIGELSPADLYVSLQAHIGRPEVLTDWMDPSIVDESDPLSVDPALDMYDPANGPPYDAAFVVRYREAQVARNQRITDWAKAELERCQAAGAFDRNFSLHRIWADLRYLDASIDPSDRPLGQCYLGDPKWANYSPFVIGSACTLRTWLSMWSLETSQCKGRPHLQKISVPALVIQSTADTGVFPVDAERIHEALGSGDKALVFIEGDHYLQTPESARGDVADRIVAWVGARGAGI